MPLLTLLPQTPQLTRQCPPYAMPWPLRLLVLKVLTLTWPMHWLTTPVLELLASSIIGLQIKLQVMEIICMSSTIRPMRPAVKPFRQRCPLVITNWQLLVIPEMVRPHVCLLTKEKKMWHTDSWLASQVQRWIILAKETLGLQMVTAPTKWYLSWTLLLRIISPSVFGVVIQAISGLHGAASNWSISALIRSLSSRTTLLMLSLQLMHTLQSLARQSPQVLWTPIRQQLVLPLQRTQRKRSVCSQFRILRMLQLPQMLVSLHMLATTRWELMFNHSTTWLTMKSWPLDLMTTSALPSLLQPPMLLPLLRLMILRL